MSHFESDKYKPEEKLKMNDAIIIFLDNQVGTNENDKIHQTNPHVEQYHIIYEMSQFVFSCFHFI